MVISVLLTIYNNQAYSRNHRVEDQLSNSFTSLNLSDVAAAAVADDNDEDELTTASNTVRYVFFARGNMTPIGHVII